MRTKPRLRFEHGRWRCYRASAEFFATNRALKHLVHERNYAAIEWAIKQNSYLSIKERIECLHQAN